QSGNLRVTDAGGQTFTYGDGTGEPVHVVFRSRRAEWAVTLDPQLALAESYMNGEIEFAEGDVLGLLRIVYSSMGSQADYLSWAVKAVEGFRYVFRRVQQFNTRRRARNNVQRHYDLSGELYRLFLDADMQYSCAYFEHPDATLEEAQL